MKKWNYILVAFLSITTLFIQSCNNDDSDSEPVQSTDNTQTNTPNDNQNDNQNDDNQNDGQTNIRLYRVEGENIVKQKDFTVTGNALALQKDTQKHQELWNLTKKIIPLEYRSKMSDFMIYTGNDSGIAGYVVNLTEDLSTWEMGIAIDYAYEGGFNAKGELAHTILHEFGHIITLDKTQVNSSVRQDNCSNYYTGSGCSRTNSNINKLQKNHWADIWQEFKKIKTQNDVNKFYKKYMDRYVTGYASTDPGEDIAEVFATFVTRTEGVNGTSGAEQKIQIMYDDNEMVKLRNYIRGNISKSSKTFLPAPGTWKITNTFDQNKAHCRLHKK